jgi:hypothetical protein
MNVFFLIKQQVFIIDNIDLYSILHLSNFALFFKEKPPWVEKITNRAAAIS